jgi:2-polyprenyl-6-hydroxyphenyl methylase/3-demethylubiquinone-9 3-methyltransferase
MVKKTIHNHQEEVKKFTDIAQDWWDINGKFAMLHRINPIRLQFILEQINKFSASYISNQSYAQIKLLDVGCGGGLLSVPMSRLGMDVTAIDPGKDNIKVAKAAAKDFKLNIDFQVTTTDKLVKDEQSEYDIVLCMEVIEHVDEPQKLLQDCVNLVKPGGLVFLAIINKTLKSLLLAKIAAEYILKLVPPGTHDWQKFIDPSDISDMMQSLNAELLDIKGMKLDIFHGVWQLVDDTDINYFCCFRKE